MVDGGGLDPLGVAGVDEQSADGDRAAVLLVGVEVDHRNTLGRETTHVASQRLEIIYLNFILFCVQRKEIWESGKEF